MQPKKIITIFLVLMMGFALFAYNPPANCDNFFNICSPETLSNASSVAGGALTNVTSGSAFLNPALIAYEQRWTIDFAYTALIPERSKIGFGNAGQFGFILPSGYGTYATVINFFAADDAVLRGSGSSCTFRGVYSKDLTNRLFIGLGLYGGFNTFNGSYNDYCVAADIGFLYFIGTVQFLPFLQNVRWAMSFTGLGKSYTTPFPGIYYNKNKLEYPAPFTLRGGIAADLCDFKYFKCGISLDAYFPSFQNFVFDIGMQFLFAKILRLSFSWEGNLREMIHGKADYYPVAALSVKFNFGDKNDSPSAGEKENKAGAFMQRHGWSQSEAEISTAYRHFYGDIHAVSGSGTVRLGSKDTQAPEIILWEDEK